MKSNQNLSEEKDSSEKDSSEAELSETESSEKEEIDNESMNDKLTMAMKARGYKIEPGGSCSSFTLISLSAFLKKNLPELLNLTKFIEEAVPEPEKLKPLSRKDFSKDEEKTPEEQSLLLDDFIDECLSWGDATKLFISVPDKFKEEFSKATEEKRDQVDKFLYSLSVAQGPHDYPEVFNKTFTSQTSPEVFKFLSSGDPEQEMQVLYKFPNIYTYEDIKICLDLFTKYAQRYQQDLALYLGAAPRHAMGLVYGFEKDCWQLLNVNKPRIETSDDIQETTSDEIKKGTMSLTLQVADGFAEVIDESLDNKSDDEDKEEPEEVLGFEIIFLTLPKNHFVGKKMIESLLKDKEFNTKVIIPEKTPNSLNLIQEKCTLKTRDHCTLAFLAATYNHDKLLAILPKTKEVLDTPIVDEGITPLMIAAQEGNLAVVKILIDSHVVNLDAQDNLKNSALSRAAFCNHLEIAALLLAGGASQKPTSWGDSPLFKATIAGNVEMVKLLLENGADPEETLHKSALFIPLLLKHGAEPEAIKTFIKSKMISRSELMHQFPVTCYEIAMLLKKGSILKEMDNVINAPGSESKRRKVTTTKHSLFQEVNESVLKSEETEKQKEQPKPTT